MFILGQFVNLYAVPHSQLSFEGIISNSRMHPLLHYVYIIGVERRRRKSRSNLRLTASNALCTVARTYNMREVTVRRVQREVLQIGILHNIASPWNRFRKSIESKKSAFKLSAYKLSVRRTKHTATTLAR